MPTRSRKLLAKINLIKSQVNNFAEFLNDYQDAQLSQLKTRLSKIEPLYDEFINLIGQLDSLEIDEPSEQHTNILEEQKVFERSYFEAIAEAQSLIPAVRDTSTPLLNQTILEPKLRLPPINLPTFSGSKGDWAEFRDTFNALVHNNATLTPIQKFTYLRGNLKDKALKVIQSLATSDANYLTAYELIYKRYQNVKLLIDNHIKNILEAPTVSSENSSSLRQLYDTMTINIRGLQALKVPVEHWDNIIVYIINSKLDSITKREWQLTKHAGETPTVEELKTFLDKRCEMLESMEGASARRSVVEPPKPKRTNVFHHSTVHRRAMQNNTAPRAEQRLNHEGSARETVHTTNHSVYNRRNDALLSTAKVNVVARNGRLFAGRCLLDSGSQSNFITQALCDKLNLQKRKIHHVVTSINAGETSIQFAATLTVKSKTNNFEKTIECLVLPKLTDNLPAMSFDRKILNLPAHIYLADDEFNVSSEVDILLGAVMYWELMGVRQIRLGEGLPVLQQTALGWILGGGMLATRQVQQRTQTFTTLNETLKRFWEIEDVSDGIADATHDEEVCERLFAETTTRADDGRFMVRIPLKDNVSELGRSRAQAERRFYQLEARLARNSELRQSYGKFMKEYESLEHMTEIAEQEEESGFYIPHLAVVKNSSLTTKVRAVFDASSKTDSGQSVNDVQYKGPTVQSDLTSILLRFRKHSIVVCGDIEKMYRQVLIATDQRYMQKILWRENVAMPLKCYALNTITYGMKSSPYLATRCLLQLAKNNEKGCPIASRVIAKDFYIDDMLTGAETVEEVIQVRDQVRSILSTAGFNLRKWSSNNALVVPIEGSGESNEVVPISKSSENKTLGVVWNPQRDTLGYAVKIVEMTRITKRKIMGAIGQIYDPLGLIGPVIVVAKMLMQDLWRAKISWDEQVPDEFVTKWKTFQQSLGEINDIQMHRQIVCNDASKIEIHGFCDASEKAYGACIYLKSMDQNNAITTRLLCAKSRVASLHSTTLPRLELCGALLLARLAKRVESALEVDISRRYFWCDATIVLCWIRGDPARWKPFVANRVSEITSITNAHEWNHVRSKYNAADVLSRGTSPSQLKQDPQWWHGPEYLRDSEEMWPKPQEFEFSKVPETRATIALVVTNVDDLGLFERYSDIDKLRRVVAYIKRFSRNALRSRAERQTGHISHEEMKESTNTIIRMAQAQRFGKEVGELKRNREVGADSSLRSLRPFLDRDQIIRVGGRLQKSDLPFDTIHQVLLPSKHVLSTLLARKEHRDQLHCGPQALLASLRQKYWPISGRNLAKQTVHKCTTCFRAKPSSLMPLMGELPRERVLAMPPFSNSGVDYAGPYTIKDKRTRGNKRVKCYVCVFVCLVTKAVHIELVGDLSAMTFIAALRRFVARRGKPLSLLSDNGTNFVGAKSELGRILSRLKADGKLSDWCLDNEIKFKFIPPRAPHFGGLWERAVGSVKHHLKRLTGSHSLVYEEFETILVQIEAILNSRPLCPLSNDPNDLNPLTPAHFLIGRPATAVLDDNLVDTCKNRLERFQALQQLLQVFWSKWKREYLNELQNRRKWARATTNIAEGDMVIIRDDLTPPCYWKLGRVISTSAGSDGVVRVAVVKTAAGEVKRAVRKLCLLPMEDV